MTRKLSAALVVGAIVGALVGAPVAAAQDFDSVMAQAAATNQQYVDQVQSALSADDLATLKARARAAIATGDRLIALLETAESVAPDDAGRSRAEGLLDHVRAAQAAGDRALAADSLDEARSALDAMRGEAVEALSEILPFRAQVSPSLPQPTQPAPTALPAAGGPFGATELAMAGIVGLLLVSVGFGLRQARLA